MPLLQRVERRRLLDDFFKAALRGSGAIATDEQRDFADARDVFKQIDQPHFANEAGDAHQQNVAVRQRFANGKTLDAGNIAMRGHRTSGRRWRARRRLRGCNQIGVLPAKPGQQLLAGQAAVRRAAGNPRQRSTRAHDRREQPPRGVAVAKFQAIGDKRGDAEVVGKRAQHVVEELTDQHNFFAGAQDPKEFFDGFAAQLRLEHVLKILFPQQVEAVLADAAQQRVQKPGGEGAARGIGERPREGHCRHAQTPGPALREALRVPGEKADQPHGAHFEQRAFHAPVGHAPRRTLYRRVLQFG